MHDKTNDYEKPFFSNNEMNVEYGDRLNDEMDNLIWFNNKQKNGEKALVKQLVNTFFKSTHRVSGWK